ncbi:hypothetical protein L218DRAFT_1006658 [Marasmius fiardii PR-910]|nr:hypothetical protein L218DRAFT_1006658 [Marasmius fiardii PR-910]
MNVIEVPVLVFLTIMWLANAGLRYADIAAYVPSASRLLFISLEQPVYSELRAAEGLSFLNWLILMSYTIGTIILCLIGKSRGNNVWLVGATEVDYFTIIKTHKQFLSN